jgi:ribosomal protein S18 acetylase RimI-like enzyme
MMGLEAAMEIERATPEDAEAIVTVVRRAFTPVAAEYGVDTLPPLADSVATLRGLMATYVVLKAVEGGRVIGSVRGVQRDGTVEVGRLVVDPDAQGRGVGRALTVALEEAFPHATRFELFTGDHPGPAMSLYEHLGYKRYRTEDVGPALRLVYMEKLRPAVG